MGVTTTTTIPPPTTAGGGYGPQIDIDLDIDLGNLENPIDDIDLGKIIKKYVCLVGLVFMSNYVYIRSTMSFRLVYRTPDR